MSRLLAIDPSMRATGAALFEDGRLVDAWLVRTKSEPVAEAAQVIAAGIAERIPTVDRLVVEWPQVYTQRRHQKGDPNDLLAVAAVAGAIVASVRTTTTSFYLPREWKAQRTKEVVQAQLLRVLAPEELAVVAGCGAIASLRHNVWDAVGIGLFASGRYG